MPFNDVDNPELILKSSAVLQAFTPELHAQLLSLIPDPTTFSELHDCLETNYAGSLKGDPEKVKACEEARQAVTQCLAILQGVARGVNPKDPTMMEKLNLGRPAEKAGSNDHTPGEAKEFRVVFDKKGRPYASLGKIPNAKLYEVWSCDGDPSVEGNWRLLVWSTKCQKIALIGLNRTKTTFLKARGVRNDIPGPWSHFISIDPV